MNHAMLIAALALATGAAAQQPKEAAMTTRTRIPPLSKFEEDVGFTRGIRAGDTIHVGGLTAVMPDGSIPPAAGAQADRIFSELIRYIEQLGGKREDVVRVRMFVTDIKDAEAVSAAFTRALKVARPTGTLIQIAALARPEWKVEIEAEAIVSTR